MRMGRIQLIAMFVTKVKQLMNEENNKILFQNPPKQKQDSLSIDSHQIDLSDPHSSIFS